MAFVFWILFLLYIGASMVLILVVLVQSGKGGGLSGLIGSGGALADSLGTTGAERTLNRWTTYCAIGFLVLTVMLVLIGQGLYKGESSLLEAVPEAPAPSAAPSAAPALPGPSTVPVPPPSTPPVSQGP